MPAKLTAEHYRQLAAQRGYEWLGAEVINNRTKTLWRCSLGHEWLMPYDNLQQGQSCPTCSRAHQHEMRRLKPADYHAIAEARGFRWVGQSVKNNRTPTEWECPQGHHWSAAMNSIREGKGCPLCHLMHQNDDKRKTPKEYHHVAKERGFEWIGEYDGDTHKPTRWRCSMQHEWLAAYHQIQAGSGCPYCSGKAAKSPEDYHQIAQLHGLVWIGQLPNTVREETKWRCAKGHDLQISYIDVYQRLGCPFCAKNQRKTAGDYADLAKARGFIWLGPMPHDTNTPTGWQCPKGHIWNAHFANVLHRESGCPECVDVVNGRRVSQPQRDLHQMIGGMLNQPAGRYRIDVGLIINRVPIAVEYDCWYWHQAPTARSRAREQFLIHNGWRILYIKAGMALPDLEDVALSISTLLDGALTVEITLHDWRDT